jgi:glycosyltransferase involved in cell wall biosynthesis
MISVVIPTYNNAAYITQALDSVFAQSFDDYEVIVVDDGSTDDTRDVLKRYGSRLHYVFQKNQGLAVARNTGLGLATRDYVTYLDADDIWREDNLRVKAEVLRAHPHLGGVFSEFLIFDETGVRHARGTRQLFPFFDRTGREFGDVFAERDTVALPAGGRADVYLGKVFDSLFWGNFILPTSMVFSRARAQQVGEFRAELRTQQDYEYWLRFTQRHPLAFVDEVLVEYRRHANQLTDHSRIENVFLAVHRIIDQYEEYFSQMGRTREYARRKAGLQTELAKVYIRQGRLPEARARLTDSIRRDVTYLPAYAALAISVVPYRWISSVRGRA